MMVSISIVLKKGFTGKERLKENSSGGEGARPCFLGATATSGRKGLKIRH